jgi:hypothetical protein
MNCLISARRNLVGRQAGEIPEAECRLHIRKAASDVVAVILAEGEGPSGARRTMRTSLISGI